MNLALDIFYCVAAFIALANAALELRRCLTMLQQNSYINSRYRAWLSQSGDSTAPLRLLGIAVLLAGMAVTVSAQGWAMLLIVAWALPTAWRTAGLRYKKPLVMTKRAGRIMGVMIAEGVALEIAMLFLFQGFLSLQRAMLVVGLTAVGIYCASHLLAMAAIVILSPVERHINEGFRRDAARILASMPGLKIVGITGSYGKTSTKHFLHKMLSEQYDTLMTPGNFNTTLGVIRTIRENLKPYNEVFIVEMGAKKVGDIADICRLVKPQAGIVTAVGPQHLDTFGSLENVQRTKFELIDALPAGAPAVVNDDFPMIASREIDKAEAIRYRTAPDTPADCGCWRAGDINYTAAGTTFTLYAPDGSPSATFKTPLLGEANISDLTAAILMARAMGVSDDKISYAAEQLRPVEHRLSVKETAGGVTIIDDAYNSNPVGSKMAMDVIRMMPCTGKRYVVTPGMVELGAEQYDLNRALGRHIAKAADVVFVVNRLNREALLEGLADADFPKGRIIEADTFAQAQEQLQTMLRPGDIVLYENDLPDTFA